MTTSATAAVLSGTGEPFVLQDVTLDDPRPDEVLVRIVAAGVCGTDLGVQGGHVPFPLPGVIGHEGAGVVEAVGSSVTSVRPGDKVLLTFTSCGTCRNCLAGHPAYCDVFVPRNLFDGARPDGSPTITGPDGTLHGHFFAQSSFATYALADERSVAKVAPDADLSLLAPLGCGIQTGAGAILNVLKPQPGDTVAVLGAGPVGLSSVMAAKLTGATTVVVVDLVDSRLELARELGATHTVNSGQVDLDEALREISGGRGFDAIVETTGNVRVLETGVGHIASLGALAIVGAPAAGSKASIDVNWVLNGKRIVSAPEGDSNPKVFLPALVDLVMQGRFPLEKLVRRYEFSEINEAAAAAKDGSVLKPVLRVSEG